MKLQLALLPANKVTPDKEYGAKIFSESFRKLAPDAAENFVAQLFPNGVTVTDMWRDAAGSIRARKRKGSQAKLPGYSGHGFGRSIDIGVTQTMRNLGFKTKAELDKWMLARKWVCWRKDGRRDIEEWHYDFDTMDYVKSSERSNANAIERWLLKHYGDQFVLKQFIKDKDEVQIALKKLGFYNGRIDGDHGPNTKAALHMFQRSVAWPEADKASAPVQRMLAFCTADIEIIRL